MGTATTQAPNKEQDMSDFVFFDSSQTSKSMTPKITVRRGGALVINHKAAEMFGKDVTHVQICYSVKTKAVGLRAAKPDTEGAFRMQKHKNINNGFLVNAAKMFKYHGLEIERATSFDVEDFGDGIYGVTLPGGPEHEEESATEAKPKRKKA